MRLARYRSLLAETAWRRNLWMLISLLMAVSNMALTGWLWHTEVREKTIVVPPAFVKPFWVQGDAVSPAYLEQMAVFFANLALTYNPDNITHQVALFLRYADPRGYGALAARLQGDAAQVTRDRLASVFYPQAVRVKDRDVTLTGQLVTWIGTKQTSLRQATFLIRFLYRDGRLFVAKFTELKEGTHAL